MPDTVLATLNIFCNLISQQPYETSVITPPF